MWRQEPNKPPKKRKKERRVNPPFASTASGPGNKSGDKAGTGNTPLGVSRAALISPGGGGAVGASQPPPPQNGPSKSGEFP